VQPPDYSPSLLVGAPALAAKKHCCIEKSNVPPRIARRVAVLEVLTRRFVLVLERGYSYGLALQLCGSALSELHPRGGLKMLKGDNILAHLISSFRQIFRYTSGSLSFASDVLGL
jgi:hypothetical protein